MGNKSAEPSATQSSPVANQQFSVGGHAISLATATAIVVANMIGVGVFTSLGFQVKAIPSGFVLLSLWIVGGVVALCGALSYGELAAALPRSGGEYHFLSRIFHPALGFLAGWISATVGFAAPVAAAAIAFGAYFDGVIPGFSPPALAFIVVWLVSLVHLRGIKHGSAFQNVATLLNVALILVLIGAGFFAGHRQPIRFAPQPGDWHLIAGAPFAVSLVYVMYAYSGWNASTYIVNEIRDPHHAVPRSLFFGTLVVLALYVGLNAVFLYTTPLDKMDDQPEVALIAGRYIFGDAGSKIVGALICLGLVSSISSMTWIGPRVAVTMGEDFSPLRIFARKNKHGVPVFAILFQLAVTNLMLWTGSFKSVVTYIQFALTSCSFLTVLGVIVLRIKEPELPRPYRTWGYPATPIIFLAVSLFMMAYLVIKQPLESGAGLATMALGLVIYFVSPKRVEFKPEGGNLKPES